jgi:tRNA (mo5U34)-methyltransferase
MGVIEYQESLSQTERHIGSVLRYHEHSMASENAALPADEIRRRIGEFEWYHRIDFGGGIVTQGTYDLEPILENYGIPESLAGKTVLDVGPGHGYFAFEFERRGAAKVVTAELPSWTDHDASPSQKALFASMREQGEAYHQGAFGFAIQAKGSRLERRFCNVYDLTPERIGTFDLVFCASVLLHLTDPLRALYGLRRVCRDQAIICTGIDTHLLATAQSSARFIGTRDGHAFWLPTMTCLEQMVLAAGFGRCERVSTFRLKSTDQKLDTPHGTVRAYVS